MKKLTLFLTLLLSFSLIGCMSTTGKSIKQQQSDILSMRQDVLTKLYKIEPSAKSKVANAVGYAVFSNANVNLIFASFSGGYGVLKSNTTGKNTYMKMGEVGLGLGIGVKDFRAVFVFHSKTSFDRFIKEGIMVGGHADAAFKAADKGAAVGGEVVVDDVTVYQITEAGLALQATIKGTKYWVDSDLN